MELGVHQAADDSTASDEGQPSSTGTRPQLPRTGRYSTWTTMFMGGWNRQVTL